MNEAEENEVCGLCHENRLPGEGVTCHYDCQHVVCLECHVRIVHFDTRCPLCMTLVEDMDLHGPALIYVRIAGSGHTLPLPVDLTRTAISNLKYMIYCDTDIHPTNQTLVYNGSQLADSSRLAQHGIGKGATVDVLRCVCAPDQPSGRVRSEPTQCRKRIINL
jgi:Ubiquitin family